MHTAGTHKWYVKDNGIVKTKQGNTAKGRFKDYKELAHIKTQSCIKIRKKRSGINTKTAI